VLNKVKMYLLISNKVKKNLFISIFQLLKNSASAINIDFKEDGVFIQGMDKSHISLFEIKIISSWFEKYEIKQADKTVISIETSIFFTVLSMTEESDTLILSYKDHPDHLQIDLICHADADVENKFNKNFKIPLIDLDIELLAIPNMEYDAEFLIDSKKINELTSQLMIFGNEMIIICDEEKINLKSIGNNGEMTVNIPIDDLKEYSISEGEIIETYFSLSNICKMALTTKLSSEISFSIHSEFPMKIQYNLGENSYMVFYIAPKIKDN
jgi:proliferating cell nuclear antigen